MAKARSTKSGRGAKGKSTKGRGGRKKAAPAHELPGGFWRQIVAILLALVAVFLVLTWMGDGGDLLNSVDGFLNSAIGNAKYLVPVLLIWMAWKIFRTENNRLAPVVWIASILMVCWAAGAFGLSSVGQENPNGGVVGEWLNQFMVQILNPSAAIIIYIILIFVTSAFILQMNPVQMVQKVGDLFRTTEKEEVPAKAKREKTEKQVAVKGAAKKTAGADVEIQVNEGVEEEAKKLKPQPKFSMFAKLGRKKDKGAEEVAEPVETATEAAGAAVAAGNSERALVAMTDVNWKLPPVSLLEKKQAAADSGDVQQTAKIIKNTLSEFGIDVEMEGANVGPRVTQYTMRPPSGVNLSKILARDKELALNLAVDKVRIEAPIPGTRSVGVELPNAKSADVRLRGVIESPEWKKATDPLTFAVGKDISGKAVVANLAKMPHLLIAGTTGSGKSVMTNSLISSLLYRNSPSDMKLIIVDPKQVEMAQYEDIPHLLTPIITSVEKALSALKWAVNEMEKRYTIMAEEKVKNIVDYNAKMAKRAEEAAASAASAKGAGAGKAGVGKNKAEAAAADSGAVEGKADEKTEKTAGAEVVDDAKTVEQQGERMPYIVILIDEMADLMMMAGKDLEMPIVRIAQKGRAAGIHLVLATQRPEVKVITGLIKANIPGRIAFAVGSQIDSRVMLDMTGAEKLLGKGDMLMLTTEMMGKPRRIQGAWASDEDVAKLTDFLRAQRGPDYNADVVAQPVQIKGMGPADGGAIGDLGRRYDPNDPVVRKAIEITLRQGKFSTASLQTWLGKGHGFVSGLAIWLEEIGVIGPAQGHKPRDVLISTMEEFDKLANGE